MAGRIGHLELTPFQLSETGADALLQLWSRGGFPPAFLAVQDHASWLWRRDFVATFLERDLPALGIRIPPQSLRRFWMMLAHYHPIADTIGEVGLAELVETVSR